MGNLIENVCSTPSPPLRYPPPDKRPIYTVRDLVPPNVALRRYPRRKRGRPGMIFPRNMFNWPDIWEQGDLGMRQAIRKIPSSARL